MLDNQVEEVELTIEEAKKHIKKRDQLRKLMANREFRQIIEEGYLKDEAIRLVGISADPSLEHRKDAIVGQIESISNFRQYLSGILRMGDQMEDALRENEMLLDELREEETLQ
jgi:hypothetical protein